MGGLSFEWEGKEYSIMGEGGFYFLGHDQGPETEDAFNNWIKTPEGREWSGEDDHGFDGDDACGYEDDGSGIDENDYWECTKCRYGCYTQFKLKGNDHECRVCMVNSCPSCAHDWSKCEDCNDWICGTCLPDTNVCADCNPSVKVDV